MAAAKPKMAVPVAEVKNGSHPLSWLNLMVTEPFYLFHLLMLFSYFVVRSSAVQDFSPDLSLHLLRREIQAVLTLSVLSAVKFVREETWEAFIADFLFYSKVFLFAVTLVIDYHVAFCYLVAFVVIFVLAQQPPYDGVGESSHLTPLQLETLFAEGNSSRFWLLITEDITCECCRISEECTPEYIRRVRDKFYGKWICGLCSIAVEEEKEKKRMKKKIEGKEEEEALNEHVSSCSRFNSIGRTHPVLYHAEAMREILRKRKKKGVIMRTSSCIPAIREEINGGDKRGGFR